MVLSTFRQVKHELRNAVRPSQ